MSFLPTVPVGGNAGWRLLGRTAETQRMAFERQPAMQREMQYFRDRIAGIGSAAELVADRRLLRVALTAFGLEGDIENRYFLRRVLEEGTLRPDALAMRLADPRYRQFSAAFGFGDLPVPRSKVSGFADRLLVGYRERRFEAAIGQSDDTLRLALNARREIGRIAASGTTPDAQWFALMGQRPLRQVVETAFGLPQAFGALDIDRQKSELQQRAMRMFGDGTVAQFVDPDRMEALIRQYLIRAQSAQPAAATLPGSTALALLVQSRPFA